MGNNGDSTSAIEVIKPNDTEAIVQSAVPYNRDDDRARYLGLRASGFKIREALKLVGIAKSTLSFWRKDPQFAAIEERLPEFRKQLAKEYANLEFLRNYRLVLEKDFRVLKKSLKMFEDNEPRELSKDEQQYLLKLRSVYTPQQLEAIEAVMKAYGATEEFDFTRLVLEKTRVRRTDG